jgi:tetratricopeptide (TPR) repeat protein
VCFFGIIDAVRKRYEGAQYDTDAFRAAAGTLPVDISYAAHVQVTRVDPEVFIPPHPGDAVRVVRGEEFQRALYFDQMEHRLPIGLTRTGEPVFANLEFLDGTRGAHASISGVSGVATKTSYATFLLYSLFHSQALGSEGINSKALIFNVKGEDLLWLDRPNVRLNPEARALYERLGLPAGAFQSVGLYAPTRRGQGAPMPDTGGRQEGVRPYLWTMREFAHDRLLRFAFVEAEANRGQLSFVIVRVERALEHAAANGPPDDPAIEIDGQRLETFDQLVDQLDGPTLGLGSPSEFFHAPWGQILYYMNRGEVELAQSLAEDLLRLGRQRNDTGGLVLGLTYSGRILMFAGKFASSRSHLEEVLALYDPISRPSLAREAGGHPHLASQAFLGVLFCLGFPDQALARSSAAIAEAQRLAHPPSLAQSLTIGTRLLSLVGDDAALEEQAGQLVAVATEQGFPLWRALGIIYRGWVKVKNGDVAEGIALLRSGSTAYRATGAELWLPYQIALLAKAYEIAGQVEEALTLLHGTLQIVERTGERWFAAELNRHKGQLLLRQGNVEAAEQLYCQALKIAEEQAAKLWELRAAVSLARLRGDQRRRAEARALLEPVYGWFTEGFATPDLKEAKALLDELT